MLLVALVASLALVVTWVVYPAVVVGLARLAGRDPALANRVADAALPDVTCVLATRDAPAVVAERVENFLAADYPPERLRVVVGIDRSAPGLADAVRAAGGALADPRVTVVDGDAPGGKCATLNAAVRDAGGELLVFSDSRQRFEPQTTRRLVSHLVTDSRVGVTSGRLLLPADRNSTVFRLYSRYELALRAAEARLHSAVGVSGSVYAMRRALWEPLPPALILDDLHVPMRLALAGHRVGFVPDAHALETRRVEAGQEFRRKVRTLTGNFQLCAWLPAILVPIRNPLWAQFLFHKLLRLLLPWEVVLIAIGVTAAVLSAAGPFAPWLIAAGLAVAAWLWVGRDAVARRLRRVAVQVASMPAAVLVATVHGLRGRWNVWHP